MIQTALKCRTAARAIPALRTREGAGVDICRAFPNSHIADPFLLLGHMGPIHSGPAKPLAFPSTRIAASKRFTYLLNGNTKTPSAITVSEKRATFNG